MRCVELFAGAGGAAIGLERAGFEHAALVELDPAACATLRAAGLGPVVEGDVRDLAAIRAVTGGGPVDLLWSSFPCQAFSQAGARRGASDERNGWPWTVDAIDEFCPTWLLAENVRGLLSHSAEHCGDPMRCPGCYFHDVILPQLRERFAHVGWWLLDSADHGVPQHRRRVIIWAGPAPLSRPVPTHGSPAQCRQVSMWGPTLRPWVTMGDALGLTAGQRAIGGGRNASDGTRSYRDLTAEPSTTMTAEQIGNAGPWVVAAGETGEVRPRPMSDAAPTIGTKGTAYLLRPSPTVACNEVKGSGAGANPHKLQRASDALYLGTGRRRLTVEECATLQAFPPGHPWQGTKTERYRQVGNAVPPTLAEVVGRQVVAAVGNAP